MAEIVRLLRWRAEWDGASLVDGAEKAAASGERVKKALEAIGATGAPALKKAATAAQETDTAFEGLGLEAQQVLRYVKALESGAGSPLAMERNVKLTEAAFNVLAQSAQKAGKAIPEAFSDRVIAAIQKTTTQAAGMNAELQKIGGLPATKLDNTIAALNKTEKATAAANVELKQAALRSQEMASGLGLLASAGGPAGMALASVASQGSRVGNEMVVLAGKLAIVGAALKGGWEAGRAFDEGLKKLGVDLADPVTGLEKLEKALRTTPEAAGNATRSITEIVTGTAALDKGLASIPPRLKDAALAALGFAKEVSGARPHVSGLAADIDLESQNLTEHTRALYADIVARKASRDATSAADAAVRAALPGWESSAAKQRETAEAIGALAEKFRDLQKNNGDWRAEVAANEGPLTKFVEGLAESKTKLSDLPQPLQAAIAYLEELRKKHESGATAATVHAAAEEAAARRAEENARNANRVGTPVTQKVDNGEREGVEVIKKTEEALLDQAAAYEGSRAAAEAAGAAARAKAEADDAARAAIEQAATVQRQMNEATHDGITEMNGWVGVQGSASIINLQVAAAEEAQIERLREILRLTRAVKEEQLEVLNQAQGWTDYVAVMVDSFEQGFTPLDQFIRGLTDFKTQLLQIYGPGGAGSAANEGLRDMLQNIQALVNAAISGQLKGGPNDPTPRGALKRAFGNRRKKK